jgi:ABC-type branched-subunit amino acid transport system ATPase component
VLDNVALGVAERRGVAMRMWASASSHKEVIEESRSLLAALGIADDAATRVADLPYGKQRLVEIAIALGLKPKVLLLDEPAAGVPSHESGIILSNLAKLPPEIAILIIEHDMDLVSASRSASRCWYRARCWWKRRRRNRARQARAPGVPRGAACLASRACAPATAPPSSSRTSTSSCRPRLARAAGTKRRRQDHAARAIMGAYDVPLRPDRFQIGTVHHKPVYERCRLGIGYVPQERMIFPSLSVHENLTSRAVPADWTSDGVYDLFPRLKGAQAPWATSSPAASSRCSPSAAR